MRAAVQLDPHPSLTEDDFVTRLETDAACGKGHRQGLAFADDLRALQAAVVVQPKLP